MKTLFGRGLFAALMFFNAGLLRQRLQKRSPPSEWDAAVADYGAG